MWDVVEELRRRGGCAPFGDIAVPHAALERALAEGVVVRDARGRYALPAVESAWREACRLDGCLSHVSAAVHRGWSVARVPRRAQVTVPRGRRVDPVEHRRIDVHYRDLDPAERAAHVTNPLRTVLDCARVLPFGEALAVADSALARRHVGEEELRRAALRARGPGSAMARRVAQVASPLAANAFESGMRAVGMGVPGLTLAPQTVVAATGARVDLADVELGLVVECDGFEYHGSREAFVADRRRYAALTLLGWVVLPFVWDDVFTDPDATRDALAAWVRQQRELFPAGRPGVWRESLRHADDHIAA